MAMAIVVDDRVDVWEAGVREQIVEASPFNHYPTAAAHACGEGPGTSRRGHSEVARILNFLTGIRRDLFHFWDNCLTPTVRQLLSRGVPNAFWATEMHAIMSASPYVNVNSMLPSCPMPLPPDSMGSRCALPSLQTVHSHCMRATCGSPRRTTHVDRSLHPTRPRPAPAGRTRTRRWRRSTRARSARGPQRRPPRRRPPPRLPSRRCR